MTSVRERTEEEKMLAGDLYLASDPVLMSKRAKATKLCREYNSADGEDDQLVRRTILESLLGSVGDDVAILSPFRVDYVGWRGILLVRRQESRQRERFNAFVWFRG
ncbi:maltose acetyltransferase-domain-containing protein [Powellomyces hirtus]|nr:maltose acetyltransferase-domain-containing protein [Powellomyces hirtus]